MSEEALIFNNSFEFVDFLNENEAVREKFNNFFPPILGNMTNMKESLSRRPCTCGGVNPDLVLQQRRDNMESFYRTWILSLENNDTENLKLIFERSVTFMALGEVLLNI